MSLMKRYIEGVSVEMGYDGEFNPEVFAEVEKRLNAAPAPEILEALEVFTCVGCGCSFCAEGNQYLCKVCATIACKGDE